MAQIFAGTAIDGSAPILDIQLGHVWICPCMFQTLVLSCHGFATNNLKINRWIFHGTKCCLRFIGVESPNTSSVNSGSCDQRRNFGQRQLRRNWETGPLLCLKFSTWAVPLALDGFLCRWDWLTRMLAHSDFTRNLQRVLYGIAFQASFKRLLKIYESYFQWCFILEMCLDFPFLSNKKSWVSSSLYRTFRRCGTLLHA